MLALLGCLLLCGCPQSGNETSDNNSPSVASSADGSARPDNIDKPTIEYPSPDPATEQATIAVIGNFRGFQKPCSCTPEQLGGLARMGTAMLQLDSLEQFSVGNARPSELPELPDEARLHPPAGAPGQPLWLIELGNFAWSPLHYPGLRAHSHLAILAALGARAAIPGTTELALDLDDAVTGLGDSPLPLVSCNLTTDIASLAIQPSLQLADNWYLLGITIATDNQGMTAQQDWWSLADPLAAAQAELARLPGDAHIVVAGCNLDEALATTLLADSRVCCCIGVPENYERRNPAEPALYRDPVPRSPDLDLYSITAEAPATIEDWRIELTELYPDDSRVMDLIHEESQQVRERLRERRAARAAAAGGSEKIEVGMSQRFLPEDQRKFSFAAEPYYVGGEQCLHCHRDAADSWRSTKHAGAVATLRTQGQAESLDCLACHSTGLLVEGGYDPLEPDLLMAAVGCENCHGPGSHHIEAKQYPDDVPEGAGNYISRDVIGGCVRCHDPYNSPHFERDSYWQQIAH